LKHPFFGQLAMRLTFVDASKWLPTAAVDGRNFYFNEKFLQSLTQKELEFVFAHEVLHCVYAHVGVFTRRGSRDPKLWNFAGDYIINQELVDQRIGEKPDIPLLLDEQFRGMFTEQVYDILYEQNKKNKQAFMEMIGQGNFDHHMDGDGDMKDGQGNDSSPCKAGDLPTVLDDNDLKEIAEKLGYDTTGKNGPIPMTDEEKANLGNEWKTATQQAARSAQAGTLPAGVKRMMDALKRPKMDWRELCQTSLKSLLKSDYTFMRPSRKTWGSDIILPGMDTDTTIDIAICIDASGSIDQPMVTEFLSEVQGIMEEFTTFKMHLWFFDTETYSKYQFDSDSVSTIADVGVVIEGGGGTDFMCNWEYLKDQDIQPNQLIMFTDGYPMGSWGDPDYCDTLFVIHGNTDIVAPFGLTAHYEYGGVKESEYA
jgi:predicted metal-dependent peptidase